MKDYKNITTFDQLIDAEHEKTGTISRNDYEEKVQQFIISEIVKESTKD